MGLSAPAYDLKLSVPRTHGPSGNHPKAAGQIQEGR